MAKIPLQETPTQLSTDAHDLFKSTQSEVSTLQRSWVDAQSRYERAAVRQGLDGQLTRRAYDSLLSVYQAYALARAEHEIARHELWESAKLAQLDHELRQRAEKK